MKSLKLIVVMTISLSCPFAFAEDGSERATQAAHQLRLAKEIREKNELTESQQLVKDKSETRKKASEESEG